jgi:hypothetical protein
MRLMEVKEPKKIKEKTTDPNEFTKEEDYKIDYSPFIKAEYPEQNKVP